MPDCSGVAFVRKVLSVKDALNHTWSYAYNNADALTGVSDPLAHGTTYAVDNLGDVTAVTG